MTVEPPKVRGHALIIMQAVDEEERDRTVPGHLGSPADDAVERVDGDDGRWPRRCGRGGSLREHDGGSTAVATHLDYRPGVRDRADRPARRQGEQRGLLRVEPPADLLRGIEYGPKARQLERAHPVDD